MDRLEEIRERQEFCQRPEKRGVAHISLDQADWLITEVDCLRASLAAKEEALRGIVAAAQQVCKESGPFISPSIGAVERLENLIAKFSTPTPADREVQVMCRQCFTHLGGVICGNVVRWEVCPSCADANHGGEGN